MTQVPTGFGAGDPLAVNGRCAKRCLPPALVCEPYGKFLEALENLDSYALTATDWELYHELEEVFTS